LALVDGARGGRHGQEAQALAMGHGPRQLLQLRSEAAALGGFRLPQRRLESGWPVQLLGYRLDPPAVMPAAPEDQFQPSLRVRLMQAPPCGALPAVDDPRSG
jgi:hypothetical protein